MFFVINKEKLNTYFISIITVIVLFVMAGTINPNGSIIETSANLAGEVQKDNINEDDDTNNYKQNILEYENE